MSGILGISLERKQKTSCQPLSNWHITRINKVSSVLDAQAYMQINVEVVKWKKVALQFKVIWRLKCYVVKTNMEKQKKM